MARMGKISTKIVMKGVEKWDTPPEDGSTKWLYDVVGIARATRTGESNYGAWTSFIGVFRAVRLDDDKIFGGDECFLPGIAEGRIAAYLQKLKDDPNGQVEFAVRVGVQKGDQQKYNYVVDSIKDPTEADPLAALMSARDKNAPALTDQSDKGGSGNKNKEKSRVAV